MQLTSGHQQVEQDRTPIVFLHQPELARQALGEPRGHCEFDFRHNHSDRFKNAGKARYQLLSASGQGVKKADRRDKYSSRLFPRRMEQYNSSQYLTYLIHLFRDAPLILEMLAKLSCSLHRGVRHKSPRHVIRIDAHCTEMSWETILQKLQN